MKPLDVVIVGAGHRSLTYASLAEKDPTAIRVVGVADPIALRREQTAKRFGFGADRCFETAEQLAAQPRFADAAINGTMDQHHVPTSLPLLEAGYDILLEKPFATNAVGGRPSQHAGGSAPRDRQRDVAPVITVDPGVLHRRRPGSGDDPASLATLAIFARDVEASVAMRMAITRPTLSITRIKRTDTVTIF